MVKKEESQENVEVVGEMSEMQTSSSNVELAADSDAQRSSVDEHSEVIEDRFEQEEGNQTLQSNIIPSFSKCWWSII